MLLTNVMLVPTLSEGEASTGWMLGLRDVSSHVIWDATLILFTLTRITG